MLYVTPDFHNPVGVTLSEARRRRLVELAKIHDFMIIEDDPYRRIKFEGPFVPPIKAFDDGGYVIGLGTVSKIFAPGVRIGWANAAPEVIRLMTTMKSDGGSCPFTQLIIAEMLRSGEIARHTAALSTELKTHRDAMVESLRTQLPGVTFHVAQGGYYLWVELPPHVESKRSHRHG